VEVREAVPDDVLQQYHALRIDAEKALQAADEPAVSANTANTGGSASGVQATAAEAVDEWDPVTSLVAEKLGFVPTNVGRPKRSVTRGNRKGKGKAVAEVRPVARLNSRSQKVVRKLIYNHPQRDSIFQQRNPNLVWHIRRTAWPEFLDLVRSAADQNDDGKGLLNLVEKDPKNTTEAESVEPDWVRLGLWAEPVRHWL